MSPTHVLGAIEVYKADLELTQCTLTNNRAWGNGGALTASKGSTLRLTACHLSGNQANEHGGSIFLLQTAKTELRFCTLSNNKGLAKGGIKVHY